MNLKPKYKIQNEKKKRLNKHREKLKRVKKYSMEKCWNYNNFKESQSAVVWVESPASPEPHQKQSSTENYKEIHKI